MSTTEPRHVWVNLTARPDGDHPGLLLDWRQRDGVGWEAWGITAEPGPSDTFVRQSWIPAASVRPLDEE